MTILPRAKPEIMMLEQDDGEIVPANLFSGRKGCLFFATFS